MLSLDEIIKQIQRSIDPKIAQMYGLIESGYHDAFWAGHAAGTKEQKQSTESCKQESRAWEKMVLDLLNDIKTRRDIVTEMMKYADPVSKPIFDQMVMLFEELLVPREE